MAPRDFLYHAVIRAIFETERMFGVSYGGLVCLSKSQRAALASKVRALAWNLGIRHN